MTSDAWNPDQLLLDGVAAQYEESRSWNYLLGTYNQYPYDNFLLAIYPPTVVAKQIRQVIDAHRRQFGFSGSARPPHILHATLCVLNDETCVDAALSVAHSVRATAFDVAFDRSQTFVGEQTDSRRRRPYVLSCDKRSNLALRCLQRQLHAPLARLGSLQRKSFSPHVTLLYDTLVAGMQMIEPIVWRVDRFALVHSHYGKTRHEVIREWRLDEGSAGDGSRGVVH
jgi:RNA 2',3'-cyclic 3'-phosphodiesterase